MATAYPVNGVKTTIFLLLMLVVQACSKHNKIYISGCNDGQAFKRVSFTNLMDSLTFYNKQYVEVTGKYQQDKGESALFNDSLLVDKIGKKALWVEFSNECPLYLTGTRIGFFDYDKNGGQLTPVNNKTITIRGEINFQNKGNLKAYKGAIDHISYVKL